MRTTAKQSSWGPAVGEEFNFLFFDTTTNDPIYIESIFSCLNRRSFSNKRILRDKGSCVARRSSLCLTCPHGVFIFKLFIFLILYDIHAFYLICILYIFIRQIFL